MISSNVFELQANRLLEIDLIIKEAESLFLLVLAQR